jgi:hypothetical protein
MKVRRAAKIKESGITFSMAKCNFSAQVLIGFLISDLPWKCILFPIIWIPDQRYLPKRQPQGS